MVKRRDLHTVGRTPRGAIRTSASGRRSTSIPATAPPAPRWGAHPREDAPAVLDQLLRELVRLLGVHPELRALPEIRAERDGRFRAHAAPFADDLAQTGRRQAGALGDTGDGQSHLFDLFAQKGAGMLGDAMGGYARHLFTPRRSARRSSVVVAQLHVPSVTVPPDEAYPPTARNANAVLSGAVAGQRFEPVARRCAQVLDAGRVVDPAQLASRPGAGSTPETISRLCR